MKKIERQAWREKLLTEIKIIIKDNEAGLSTKNEKALKKTIRQVVKKTAKKRKKAPINHILHQII